MVVVVTVVMVVLLLVLGCCSDAASVSSNSSEIQIRLSSSRRRCEGVTVNTTDTFAVIHSPVRQSRTVRCQWVIENTHQYTLQLSFTQFRLARECAGYTHKCCAEWVRIYTNESEAKRKRNRKLWQGPLPFQPLPHAIDRGEGQGVCGDVLPSPVVTQAPRVFVEYVRLSQLRMDGETGFTLVLFQAKNSECRPHEYRCSKSHLCIPLEHLCNGEMDCPDHSDETACGGKVEGEVEEVEEGEVCDVSSYVKCDGFWQCENGQDEKGCKGCGGDRWWCGVGVECYGVDQRCDGTPHCSNAKDEVDCSEKCPNQIPCWGKECYLPYQRCNGLPDCSDGADEDNCTPYQCNQQNGTYLCENSRCIRQTWLCDEMDDCRDGSDERECLRNSVIGVAAVGGLMCSLLLIIAMGCSGRLYALRTGLTRLQGGEGGPGGAGPQGRGSGAPLSPRTRLEECLLQRELPPPYHVAVNDHTGFLFRAWAGCQRSWRLPSLQHNTTRRGAPHPSSSPSSPPSPSRLPLFGNLPPDSPHSSTTPQDGGEKMEDDVPLLSAVEESGENEGREDVSLLSDLSSSSSSSSSSVCDLDSDTRAAVLALSAVQSHINSIDSDTEMI